MNGYVVDVRWARWAAVRTVMMHAEPPAEKRVTGVCRHCGEGDPCPTLVSAIHYLRSLDRAA